jgi:1-deoxy-D-xylulose-5-phosphate reductoisomerase
LARQALAAGGTAPAVLNAANEVCVEAFLASRIAFLDIPDLVARCLDHAAGSGLVAPMTDFDHVMQVDEEARRVARSMIPAG